MFMTKEAILFRLLGDAGLEAVRLDEYLKIFASNDGLPRPGVKSIPVNPDVAHVDSRVTERLTEEGMLKPYLDGYVITSKGIEFVNDGGYSKQLLYKKAGRLNFWLSLLAVAISTAAFFRSC